MDKNTAIRNIEDLFPMDSHYSDTAKTGESLVIEALRQTNWRNLPEETLRVLARLNTEKELAQ